MKTFAFLLLFLLTAFNTNAQIQVFKTNDNYFVDSTRTNKGRETIYGSIGLNPLLIFKGVVGIFGQISNNEKIVLRAGIGTTFGDILFEDPIFHNFDKINTNENYIFQYDGYEIKRKPGYFLELGLKFYPIEHDELCGFYISPGIRTKYHYASYIGNKLDYTMLEPEFRIGIETSHAHYNEHENRIHMDYYLGIQYSTIRIFGIKDIPNTINTFEPIKQTYNRIYPMLGFSCFYTF